MTVWTTFEDPSSSAIANAISFVILFVIILSIMNFVIGSFPDDFCRWENAYDPDGGGTRQCSAVRIEESATTKVIEASCIFIFTAEYLARLLSCGVVMPAWQFVLDPLNLLDLVAILPWYVTTLLSLLMGGENGMAKVLGIVRIVRLTRILRVFKASKSMKMMLVLARTMRRSGMALSVLLVAVMGQMVAFGAMVVVFERGEWNPHLQQYVTPSGSSSPFYSIPQAMYWCMATMTTVGYGDLYPTTGLGQAVGILAMLLGIVVLSLPITVIGSTFSEEFEEQNRIEVRERRLADVRQQAAEAAGMAPPKQPRKLSQRISAARFRDSVAPAPAPTSIDPVDARRLAAMPPGFMQCEWLLDDYKDTASNEMKQFILRSEADLLRMTRKVIIQSRVLHGRRFVSRKRRMQTMVGALSRVQTGSSLGASSRHDGEGSPSPSGREQGPGMMRAESLSPCDSSTVAAGEAASATLTDATHAMAGEGAEVAPALTPKQVSVESSTGDGAEEPSLATPPDAPDATEPAESSSGIVTPPGAE